MQKDGRFVGFSEFPTVDLLAEAQVVYAATNVQTNVHVKRVDGGVPDPLPPPTTKRDVFKSEEFKEIDAHARQVTVKPGVHTNDFAPIYGRRALKLGHASLATIFRAGRLTFQPILRENLESPVIRSQPITTAVITDACLNTRWHHGACISPQ